MAKTKRVKVGDEMENVVELQPEQYAELINENARLRGLVVDLSQMLDFKKTGIPSDKLIRSVRYKVGQFVLSVQANNTAEDVVKRIDRAAKDIVQFVSNFSMETEKDTFKDGILFLEEE